MTNAPVPLTGSSYWPLQKLPEDEGFSSSAVPHVWNCTLSIPLWNTRRQIGPRLQLTICLKGRCGSHVAACYLSKNSIQVPTQWPQAPFIVGGLQQVNVSSPMDRQSPLKEAGHVRSTHSSRHQCQSVAIQGCLLWIRFAFTGLRVKATRIRGPP